MDNKVTDLQGQTFHFPLFLVLKLKMYRGYISAGVQKIVYLRLHVKQVTYSHAGVAFAVTISLCEELVLGPGHVNPLGPSVGLVIYHGVRGCVSVMDELGLGNREREG